VPSAGTERRNCCAARWSFSNYRPRRGSGGSSPRRAVGAGRRGAWAPVTIAGLVAFVASGSHLRRVRGHAALKIGEVDAPAPIRHAQTRRHIRGASVAADGEGTSGRRAARRRATLPESQGLAEAGADPGAPGAVAPPSSTRQRTAVVGARRRVRSCGRGDRHASSAIAPKWISVCSPRAMRSIGCRAVVVVEHSKCIPGASGRSARGKSYSSSAAAARWIQRRNQRPR
jgi:hypothetical protein